MMTTTIVKVPTKSTVGIFFKKYLKNDGAKWEDWGGGRDVTENTAIVHVGCNMCGKQDRTFWNSVGGMKHESMLYSVKLNKPYKNYFKM